MANENYNIDDILSEIKRRREESEQPAAVAEPAPEQMPQGTIFPMGQSPAERAAAPVEEPVAEEPTVAAPVTEEPVVEEPTIAAPFTEAPVTEEPTVAAPIVEEPTAVAEPEPEPQMVNLLDLVEEASDAPVIDRSVEEVAPRPATAPTAKPKKKKNKALRAVIIVLVLLIAFTGVTAAVVANRWLNELTDNGGVDTDGFSQTQWRGMDELVESFDPIQETEGTELSSLEDMVKTWFYNGTPASSSHVMNILLIGEDTRGDEILESGTRADSAIIASLNNDTKEIVLTSILRDSWAYWEKTPGDESTGSFGKINGAMSTGSVAAYINCLEHLYKVDIDSYAIVNFSSFETIVDTLGGVTLELTQKEINEINNHPGTYGDVYIDGSAGELKLDGKQALAYCRIRHIDSDNARADRQKTTLMAIAEQTKDASTTKLLQVMNELIPYVKTGFGKSDLIKIGTYALSHGWMGYKIHTQNLPEANLTGGIYGSDFGKQWVWRADFPADAYNLQMRIYGKSNITLAQERVNVKKVQQSGFYQDGAKATSSTYTNDAYGEVTTVAPWEDEEEAETEEVEE